MLNIFNRLINITKENNVVQNFIKELNEFIEDNFSKHDIPNSTRKEQSLIQELQKQNKLTTSYRDKMHVERSHILQDYAEKTANKGTMYYIYNKDNNEKDTYHLCICDKENSHKVIKVQGKDLPEDAGVDTVLRMEKGKYTIDKEATNKVHERMEEMIEKLLKEQSQKVEEKRIEGHDYEVVEVSSKEVTLIDITKDKNNGECFEELTSKRNFLNIKEGDILKYINGEYIINVE